MATFTKFQSFVEALAEEKHNLGSDTLELYLTNTEPSASGDAVKTDLPAEIAYTNLQNDPTSRQFTATTSAQTSGTYTLDAANIVLTASGGTVGPFQYVVIFNQTAPSDELIGYYNYGSAVTLQAGETFTVTFDAAGILTIA